MHEQYAKLFKSELESYQKIQDTLNELAATSYENVGSNRQILPSYQYIQELQVTEALCIRDLLSDEDFKKAPENTVFINFIENCLNLNALNEDQKYDLYSLIYKLSTVEPGEKLLRYFIDNDSEISIKPGDKPTAKAKEKLILFPLRPNFHALSLYGGTKPTRLISEVRHISLGHELIHLYHEFADIKPSPAFEKSIRNAGAKSRLYALYPLITVIQFNEVLTIEGDMNQENEALITENSLRQAFKLETRLGWRCASLEDRRTIQDVLGLIDLAHKTQSSSLDSSVQSIVPQNSTTAPLVQNKVVPSLMPSIFSFFNFHSKPTEESWALHTFERHKCTIL